jgi:biotin carboxyl carrier protein
VSGRWYTVKIEDINVSPVTVNVDGETMLVEVEELPGTASPAKNPKLASKAPSSAVRSPQTEASVSDTLIRAPMAGRVMSVDVSVGSPVTKGQDLCVIEAMKMEQSIRSPRDGVVKVVHVTPMQQLATNDPMIDLE